MIDRLLPTEILHIVLRYLDRRSLTACAQVNRTVGEIATQHLWKTIRFSSPKSLSCIRSPEGRRGLLKNRTLVQELDLVTVSMLSLFVSTTTTTLSDADQQQEEQEQQQEHEQQQQEQQQQPKYEKPTAIIKCPNLRKLKVKMHNEDASYFHIESSSHWDSELKPEVAVGINELIQSSESLTSVKIMTRLPSSVLFQIVFSKTLPFLTKLDLSSSLNFDEAAHLLNHMPSRIQSLKLREISGYYSSLDSGSGSAGFGSGYDQSSPYLPNRSFSFVQQQQQQQQQQQPENHLALEELHLFGDFDRENSEALLLPFLNSCGKNLNKFSVNSISPFLNDAVRETLRGLGIYLEVVQTGLLENEEDGDDDEAIAEAISVSDRLRMVDLGRCTDVGPLTISAIMQSADYVTSIDLSCHGRFSSTDVIMLLQSTPNLVSFYTSYPGFWCDTPPPLSMSAIQFLSIQWASLSIERLGCVIIIPRPKEDVPEEYRIDELTCETIDESRAIQRQVLRHLAKQTKLSNLHLGACCGEYSDPVHLWYSLDLSLESGLEDLSNMKISTLSIHHMNVKIGMDELNYMASHWNASWSLRIEGLYDHQSKVPSDMMEWQIRNRCFLN